MTDKKKYCYTLISIDYSEEIEYSRRKNEDSDTFMSTVLKTIYSLLNLKMILINVITVYQAYN